MARESVKMGGCGLGGEVTEQEEKSLKAKPPECLLCASSYIRIYKHDVGSL